MKRRPIGSQTAQALQLRGDRSYNIAMSNMAGAAIDRASAPGQHLSAVTVLARDRREGRGVAYPKLRTDSNPIKGRYPRSRHIGIGLERRLGRALSAARDIRSLRISTMVENTAQVS